MTIGVSRELTWTITTLWIALFIGWIIDSFPLALLGYLLFYIARHLYSVRKFELWMKKDSNALYPPSSGFWAEVAHLVSRKQRSLEKHADLQLHKYEQFQAASMSIPDAIISINPKGKIEWFNAAAKKMLKLKQSDVGYSLEMLLRVPEFIRYFKNEDYSQPLILPSLKGTQRVFSVSVFRYYLHHKLVVIKDIHELYNLAQIRKDFIANASHELRTPLTVFNGYIEMMIEMQEPDSPWEKPLAQMHQQSQRMQSIINDLLTLSAMESETLIEEKQPVDVPEILANLQKDAELMSHEKHQFVFDIDPSLKIVGYLTPLTSVFTNLISNAVRYTPDQGKITVRWYHRDKFIYFEVEDTGIGIAREHLSRITERFYRVDAARSRETGGTGLGLAIVKHILERHQAQLVIESQLGRGSHFICKFPAELMVVEGQMPKALADATGKPVEPD